MSPWWVIHSSALKASPLPEPTSLAASRVQLHITSSSFSCSSPIRFALMQDKSCTKLLRNRPLRLFPATPRLFETLHQDLPVLLFPWLLFFHPCLHLGGGGFSSTQPHTQSCWEEAAATAAPSSHPAPSQPGCSTESQALWQQWQQGGSSSCCTFKKNQQILC